MKTVPFSSVDRDFQSLGMRYFDSIKDERFYNIKQKTREPDSRVAGKAKSTA
jgi:hypothetical protein